jgi:hypothetical protein
VAGRAYYRKPAQVLGATRPTQTVIIDAIPTDPSLAWRHDVAAGASWTIATRLTLNIEYHFHQGALTRDDWSRRFAVGRANPLLARRALVHPRLRRRPATPCPIAGRSRWP